MARISYMDKLFLESAIRDCLKTMGRVELEQLIGKIIDVAQGSLMVKRRSHSPETAGSNPAPVAQKGKKDA